MVAVMITLEYRDHQTHAFRDGAHLFSTHAAPLGVELRYARAGVPVRWHLPPPPLAISVTLDDLTGTALVCPARRVIAAHGPPALAQAIADGRIRHDALAVALALGYTVSP